MIYDLAVVVNAWCFNKGVFEKKKISKFNFWLSINPNTRKKGEIDSMNIILRGASLRFYLTRKIDNFKKKKSFVTKKDPNEFYKILKFHISAEDEFKY